MIAFDGILYPGMIHVRWPRIYGSKQGIAFAQSEKNTFTLNDSEIDSSYNKNFMTGI